MESNEASKLSGDEIRFDCQYIILEFLPTEKDLITVASCSKKWTFSVAARSDRFWKKRLEVLCKESEHEIKQFEEKIQLRTTLFEKYKISRLELWKIKPKIITWGSVKDRKINKLVVEGSGAVGKTCLLIRYLNSSFPEDYVPTVLDNVVVSQIYKGEKKVEFSIWDCAGQESYDRLRKLSYPETDLFLLCFSMVNARSLEDIERWKRDTYEVEPNGKYLLVGTKSDLKTDSGYYKDYWDRDVKIVTRDEGEKMAEKIGAVKFVEVSALNGDGIHQLFQDICCILEGEHKKEEKKDRCLVM